MYNTKPIIDLMARYNNGCISKQALIFISQYVSKEDKDYIESAGYTLVDHYAEKPKFDLAEIQACFDLYKTTGEVSTIIYCRSLFEFFFIKKWNRFKYCLSSQKCDEELEMIQGDYMAAAYEVFFQLFEYCVNRKQSPEAFIFYLSRRTDSNLFYTLLQENFAAYGLKKNSAGQLLSLDSMIGDNDKTLLETIPDPTDGISQLESQITVDSMLSILTDRQRQIVEMHLGLYDGEKIKFSDISKILGIPAKTVGREYERATKRLRDLL